MSEDRRRVARIPIAVQIEGADGEVGFVLGYTRDVSVSGLFVQVLVRYNPAQQARVGERIMMRFRPPTSGAPLVIFGEVTRSEVSDSNGSLIGFGVRFDELLKEDAFALVSFVHEDDELLSEESDLH